MTAAVLDDPLGSKSPLPPHVAMLSHAIRWIAVAWIGWGLVQVWTRWSDFEAIKRGWGHYLKQDLSALPVEHYWVAFAVVLIDWAIAAVIVVFVWRLFGCYLRGKIFSAVAVREMRLLGFAGVVAVGADILARPLIQAIFSLHLAGAKPTSGVLPTSGVWPPSGVWIEPNDLLHLLMALALVALAVIFKSGVEIAEDHRQIV